jgi:hypothetical protein
VSCTRDGTIPALGWAIKRAGSRESLAFYDVVIFAAVASQSLLTDQEYLFNIVTNNLAGNSLKRIKHE